MYLQLLFTTGFLFVHLVVKRHCAEWYICRVCHWRLLSHSSAKGGEFLCAYLKCQFNTCVWAWFCDITISKHFVSAVTLLKQNALYLHIHRFWAPQWAIRCRCDFNYCQLGTWTTTSKIIIHSPVFLYILTENSSSQSLKSLSQLCQISPLCLCY